jgi:hypothetical protein
MASEVGLGAVESSADALVREAQVTGDDGERDAVLVHRHVAHHGTRFEHGPAQTRAGDLLRAADDLADVRAKDLSTNSDDSDLRPLALPCAPPF